MVKATRRHRIKANEQKCHPHRSSQHGLDQKSSRCNYECSLNLVTTPNPNPTARDRRMEVGCMRSLNRLPTSLCQHGHLPWQLLKMTGQLVARKNGSCPLWLQRICLETVMQINRCFCLSVCPGIRPSACENQGRRVSLRLLDRMDLKRRCLGCNVDLSDTDFDQYVPTLLVFRRPSG